MHSTFTLSRAKRWKTRGESSLLHLTFYFVDIQTTNFVEIVFLYRLGTAINRSTWLFFWCCCFSWEDCSLDFLFTNGFGVSLLCIAPPINILVVLMMVFRLSVFISFFQPSLPRIVHSAQWESICGHKKRESGRLMALMAYKFLDTWWDTW